MQESAVPRPFMRRLALLSLLLVARVRADEPHLEFVDRLRADGMADIALDYLDHLAKNPPASVASRLPLERAKTLAALAEQSDDDKQRDDRLTQARIAFEQYLQTQTDGRIVADLRLELARMILRQGRFRVMVARHLDNKSERQDGFARARLLFDAAGR